MTKLMAMESTRIQTVQSTKAIGKKTCSTDGVLKNGLTAPNTKETTCRVVNMDKDPIYGRTAPVILETGTKTKYMVRASMSGLTVVVTMETGQATTWTGLESTLGETAENMKDSI